MEKSSQEFKKKGKRLIICIIAALFLCPVACDRNEFLYLAGGGGKVKLPTHSYWQKDHGDDVREGDILFAFYTMDGSDWGMLELSFTDMYVEIKRNKMYDRAGEYVGRLRLKRNGDLVIYGVTANYDINGTYHK